MSDEHLDHEVRALYGLPEIITNGISTSRQRDLFCEALFGVPLDEFRQWLMRLERKFDDDQIRQSSFREEALTRLAEIGLGYDLRFKHQDEDIKNLKSRVDELEADRELIHDLEKRASREDDTYKYHRSVWWMAMLALLGSLASLLALFKHGG